MTDHAQPRQYPFNADECLELDPIYRELREHAPLSRVKLPYGESAWLATRHADIQTVLSDARFSRAAALGRDTPRSTPEALPAFGIMGMDPPDHTRLRRLVAGTFTSRRVEQLRPRIREIAEELADALANAPVGTSPDLVTGFARPMATAVICELLGIPADDRSQFQGWSDAILSTSDDLQAMQSAFFAMWTYVTEVVAERRSAPKNDLVSALVSARDEEGRLSEDELVGLILAILLAGNETSASQLANIWYVLLTRTDEHRQLLSDRTLIPRAVDELLRFIPLSSAEAFPRYALEDVELSGTVVRTGEPVLVSAAAGNRDENVFADAESLDFTREKIPHLAFGFGAHRCLGAQLAKAELEVAVEVLLDRFPGLKLAVAETELTWKQGSLIRGVATLPVHR